MSIYSVPDTSTPSLASSMDDREEKRGRRHEVIADGLSSQSFSFFSSEDETNKKSSLGRRSLQGDASHSRTMPKKTQEPSKWVEALVVVRFDLKDGQIIEALNPELASLSEKTKKKICFLSLPDHNTGTDGDMLYTFRLRSSKRNASGRRTFLYCSVFFRQNRDPSQPRGYFQKSLVVVSKLPFASFLEKCARIIGPLYFSFGSKILEEAMGDIAQWPILESLKVFDLNLIGSQISFRAPSRLNFSPGTLFSPEEPVLSVDGDEQAENAANPTHKTDFDNVEMNLHEVFEERNRDFPGDFQDSELFSVFGSSVTALWHLWELVLIGKPILVLSSTPQKVSNAVLGLVSLISPLNYSSDFRPYFTIYDEDFQKLTSLIEKKNNLPGLILGVTNPYFLKALQFFPNVVALAKDHVKDSIRLGSFDLRSVPEDEKTGSGCFPGFNNKSSNLQFLGRDYIIHDPNDRRRTSSRLSEDSVIDIGSARPELVSLPSDNSLTDQTGKRHKMMKRIRTSKHSARSGSFKELRLLKMSRYSPRIASKNESLDLLLSNHDYEESSVLCRERPLVEPDYDVLNQLFFYSSNSDGNLQSLSHSRFSADSKSAPKTAAVPSLSLNNQVLRQHFQKLTKSFLKPLERYLDLSQLGSRKAKEYLGISFSAYNSTERGFNLSDSFVRFNITSFLEFLENNPPSAEVLRPNAKELYRRFILGPNFKHWYVTKITQLDKKLNTIYRHLRLNIDALSLLKAVEQEYRVSEQSRVLSAKRFQPLKWLVDPELDARLDNLVTFGLFRTPENELITRIEDAIKTEKRNKDYDPILVARMEKHLKDVQTIKALGRGTVEAGFCRKNARSQSHRKSMDSTDLPLANC